MNNIIYDIVIVGASKEGIEFAKLVDKELVDKTAAIISRNFPSNFSLTTCQCLTGDIAYISYKYGLINLRTKTNAAIFCKNVVIAVGSIPEKFGIQNQNIYYNINKLPCRRTRQIIVTGDLPETATAALEVSKKFKYVYLCTKSFSLSCDPVTALKIDETTNIIHLPNCQIVKCKNQSDGELKEVQLSTYEVIHAATILAVTPRVADTGWINKRIINLDSENKIVITKAGNSVSLPSAFAIGDCAAEVEDRAIKTKAVFSSLIKQNNWR